MPEQITSPLAGAVSHAARLADEGKLYWLPCLAALLVALPTLFLGLFVDDYIHILSLEHQIPDASALNLFRFAPGDPARLEQYMGALPYPWFTLPELSLQFFRPLSSLTMLLDHLIFGRTAFWYHAHSILWYLALCALVTRLFQRTLPPRLALLCALLYAIDDGHFLPAGWWSNRNALVAAVPAVMALLAHLQWRQGGSKRWIIVEMLAFAVGLLGGEGALGITGFLFAYEVFASGALRRRMAALAPAACVAVVYLLAYKAGGYGVHGSGIYFDPLGEFSSFVAHAPERLALLAGAQFWSFPAEMPAVTPFPLPAASVFCLLALLPVLWLLKLQWPGLEPSERHAIRWLSLGAVLAAAPALSTFASGRLLVIPSIGLTPLMAILLRAWWQNAKQMRFPSLLRITGWLLAVVHLVLAPLTWLGLSVAIPLVSAGTNEVLARSAAAKLPPDAIAVVLNATDPLFGMYSPILLRFYGLNPPAAWYTLVMVPHELRLTRVGQNVIRLDSLDGPLLRTQYEHLFRNPDVPLNPGTKVAANDFEVEILEAEGGKPRSMLFRWKADSSPHLNFLVWEEGTFKKLDLPALGQSIQLARQASFFHPSLLLREVFR